MLMQAAPCMFAQALRQTDYVSLLGSNESNRDDFFDYFDFEVKKAEALRAKYVDSSTAPRF